MIDNLINHVCLLLDGSGSMYHLRESVIKVVDAQIAWLAQRSKELNQETRLTGYVFDDRVECILFDIDVLRVPSIRDLYWTRGMTALRDATIQSQQELGQTFTKYGNHAFLTFVVTDGLDNASHRDQLALHSTLANLPENWTVAALVPDMETVEIAESQGFPPGNITIWDATSKLGMERAGEKIKAATDSFMTSRTLDVHSSKTMFVDAGKISKEKIDAAGLKALDYSEFFLFPAASDGHIDIYQSGRKTKARPNGIACVQISDMVRSTGREYVMGKAFYELTKSEKIDAQKDVAVIHRATAKVYLGREARKLIGLDDHARRVRPMPKVKGQEPEYDIFVQSTSTNRHVPLGNRILLLLK